MSFSCTVIFPCFTAISILDSLNLLSFASCRVWTEIIKNKKISKAVANKRWIKNPALCSCYSYNVFNQKPNSQTSSDSKTIQTSTSAYFSVTSSFPLVKLYPRLQPSFIYMVMAQPWSNKHQFFQKKQLLESKSNVSFLTYSWWLVWSSVQ